MASNIYSDMIHIGQWSPNLISNAQNIKSILLRICFHYFKHPYFQKLNIENISVLCWYSWGPHIQTNCMKCWGVNKIGPEIINNHWQTIGFTCNCDIQLLNVLFPQCIFYVIFIDSLVVWAWMEKTLQITITHAQVLVLRTNVKVSFGSCFDTVLISIGLCFYANEFSYGKSF